MRRLCITGFLILFTAYSAMWAQEPDTQANAQEDTVSASVPPESGESPLQHLFSRFRGRPLMLDINARVVEPNETVTWNESHTKSTIPGRPVGIKLVGTNLVVAVQFTPYLRQRGAQKFLVAQGQIWMEVPGQGIRYHSSMQTIPLEFGEPIFFFPLGPHNDEDAARIEVMLTLYPYEEN